MENSMKKNGEQLKKIFNQYSSREFVLKEKMFNKNMQLWCLRRYQKTQNEMYRKHAITFYKLVKSLESKLKSFKKPLLSLLLN